MLGTCPVYRLTLCQTFFASIPAPRANAKNGISTGTDDEENRAAGQQLLSEERTT
jgi:hypothetical protein